MITKYIFLTFVLMNISNALAIESVVVIKGNYSKYNAQALFKCFEVLDQPKPFSQNIFFAPIRALLNKESCPPELDCIRSPEANGHIYISTEKISFVLENGYNSDLTSVFMKSKAIYGLRSGNPDVYFYIENPRFSCHQ